MKNNLDAAWRRLSASEQRQVCIWYLYRTDINAPKDRTGVIDSDNLSCVYEQLIAIGWDLA